jgi:hypothetical protein
VETAVLAFRNIGRDKSANSGNGMLDRLFKYPGGDLMKKILATIFILFLAVAAYSQTAIVIGDQAKMYSVPSEKGKVRKVLAKNASVDVIGQKVPWYEARKAITALSPTATNL